MVKITRKLLMKFKVEHKGSHFSRVGSIVDPVEKALHNQVLVTPLCLLYTQGGSVPHLTHEVLQFLTTERLPVILPLPSTITFRESMSAFPWGIGKFVGLDEYPLYCSVQDPAVETRTGFNDKTTISVWSYTGRIKLDVENFMSIQERYQPWAFQALCSSDTASGCSKKRISHSVSRSLEMLDGCLQRKLQSDVLRSKCIFGSIQGGYDVNARRFSAQETVQRPVDGFVIDGFHTNGPECESMEFADVKPLLEEIMPILPPDKPRVMHGAFRPDFIVQAVESGIDVFDSSFPFLVTERGCALVFDYKLDEVKNNCAVKDEIFCRTLEIDLNDTGFSSDFCPILQGCLCYTCQNFTRAYINHLLLTSELLSGVLLMLHNLHHFLGFFKTIKLAIQNDQLHILREKLVRSCKQKKDEVKTILS